MLDPLNDQERTCVAFLSRSILDSLATHGLLSQRALLACAKRGKQGRIMDVVAEAVLIWEDESKKSLTSLDGGTRDQSSNRASRAFRRWKKHG